MKIGHAHIKVRDLERAVEFYCEFLDLKVTESIGEHFVFLTSAGDGAQLPMHHEIALQRVPASAPVPGRFAVGLFHVAFEVPSKAAFAHSVNRLQDAGIPMAAVDHRISWAVYFSDPDGNGLEIYWDTRKEPSGSMLWERNDRALTTEQIFG